MIGDRKDEAEHDQQTEDDQDVSGGRVALGHGVSFSVKPAACPATTAS
jgi:hypothetical protein